MCRGSGRGRARLPRELPVYHDLLPHLSEGIIESDGPMQQQSLNTSFVAQLNRSLLCLLLAMPRPW